MPFVMMALIHSPVTVKMVGLVPIVNMILMIVILIRVQMVVPVTTWELTHFGVFVPLAKQGRDVKQLSHTVKAVLAEMVLHV